MFFITLHVLQNSFPVSMQRRQQQQQQEPASMPSSVSSGIQTFFLLVLEHLLARYLAITNMVNPLQLIVDSISYTNCCHWKSYVCRCKWQTGKFSDSSVRLSLPPKRWSLKEYQLIAGYKCCHRCYHGDEIIQNTWRPYWIGCTWREPPLLV